MEKLQINRIKAVLAEKGKTSKELSRDLNKGLSTVSRWCTNDNQPSLESLYEISQYLNVDIRELLVSNKK